MRTLLLVVALTLGLLSQSLAATLTVTVGSFSNSKTISNADITRIVEAQKKNVNNPNLTNQQAFDLVVAEIHQMLRQIVINAEGTTAIQTIVPPAIQ